MSSQRIASWLLLGGGLLTHPPWGKKACFSGLLRKDLGCMTLDLDKEITAASFQMLCCLRASELMSRVDGVNSVANEWIGSSLWRRLKSTSWQIHLPLHIPYNGGDLHLFPECQAETWDIQWLPCSTQDVKLFDQVYSYQFLQFSPSTPTLWYRCEWAPTNASATPVYLSP